MAFFDKLKNGLKKTKDSIFGQIDTLFKKFVRVDEELLEELEELLIMADTGVSSAEEIINKLRDRIKSERINDGIHAKEALKSILVEMIGEGEPLNLDTKPSVILVIGVNGVGKTTSVAKLAGLLKNSGRRVMLAAADTFRAAAIDQLQIWSERVGVELVKHNEGSDPAAVVFDAINAVKSRKADVLIVDTAGRLHNKKNLMDELAKINRVINRELPGCARETLLVLDATTGQNAVNQAKEFMKTADISGLIMTKLDGTAKGGIVFSIKKELNIPVKFICVGEQVDDLEAFDARQFVDALFE
ncbi:MAG: signal recognition particle-docking protein FtsY [Eubacteriales bacterium]|nr:signal recognition particle-docking protein FtsY [Eubacteriales bacterium]